MRYEPEDNGILGKVPGEVIAKAMKSLPECETCPDQHREVEIDVPPPWG
jgi:hypothetical protein